MWQELRYLVKAHEAWFCRVFADFEGMGSEGFTFGGHLAEAAVVSWYLFAFSVPCLKGSRCEFMSSPVHEVCGGHSPARFVSQARLDDRHSNVGDVVEFTLSAVGSQRVAHHLCIVFCFYLDALSVFQVEDLEGVSVYQHGVAGSESFRDEF